MIFSTYYCMYDEYNTHSKRVEVVRETVNEQRFDNYEDAYVFITAKGLKENLLKDHDKNESVVLDKMINDNWVCSSYERTK